MHDFVFVFEAREVFIASIDQYTRLRAPPFWQVFLLGFGVTVAVVGWFTTADYESTSYNNGDLKPKEQPGCTIELEPV